MVRSFQSLMSADPGFNTEQMLTLRVSLPEVTYPEPQERHAFYNQTLQNLRTLPGVQSASTVQTLPLDGSNSWSGVTFEGRAIEDPRDRPSIGYLSIHDDYFETLRIPLIRGRDLEGRDLLGDKARVAIANVTLVERFFPDSDALGRRFRFASPDEDEDPEEVDWFTIVGIVADIRHSGLEEAPRPELYLPAQQRAYTSRTLVLRTHGDPLALAQQVRQAIWDVDPTQPVYGIRTMEQVIHEQTGGARVSAQILGVLAGAALLLAAIGIYGVISFAVSQRTSEIGIRRAIGAQRRDVLTLMLRESVVPIGSGLLAGLVLAFAVSQTVKSILFGISPNDPSTYLWTTVVLAIVALVAIYIPSLRATRVAPLIVLRTE